MQRPDPDVPFLLLKISGSPSRESVVCLVSGDEAVYGMTFPAGISSSGASDGQDRGQRSGLRPPLNEEPFRSIPRALVRDAKDESGDRGLWIALPL